MADNVERDGARVGLPPGNDREIVDKVTLSEMLGKLGDAITELRDVLRPVGITTDVLGTLRVVDSDRVGKLRDSVGELSEGIVEPSVVRVVRPELRDTAGKVTDVLSTFDNELGLE